MNPVQIAVVLRGLVMIFGPWLAANGYLTDAQMRDLGDPEAVGKVLGYGSAALALGWSIWAHRPTGLISAAAAWLNGRRGVVIAPQHIADRLPDNVVSSVTAAATVPGVAR